MKVYKPFFQIIKNHEITNVQVLQIWYPKIYALLVDVNIMK